MKNASNKERCAALKLINAMYSIPKWVFCTHNQHKIEEAQKIVADKIYLLSLSEVNFFDEVQETGNTFKENAFLKANVVWEATGLPCVADDSGLCVEALNNAPGIYSARYAGIPVNHKANIDKLLADLSGVPNREAYFITVLCIVGVLEQPLYVEGKVFGSITDSIAGSGGFGYDPIFKPKGYDLTFAEMNADTKNEISHRALAFKELMDLYASSSMEVN